MNDRADRGARPALERIVVESSTIATHCLAGAERAVVEGRFNIAKILRACAHSARVTALITARVLATDVPPAELLARHQALLQRQARDREAMSTWLSAHGSTSGTAPSVRDAAPATPLEDVLRRALMSLQHNRDVLESDVAPSLWGCHVCGAIVEGPAPAGCTQCGALRFEFEWFGPFYSSTLERLGRRSPAEIATILRETPSRLAALVEGVDEERLARRPTADEWCMKEIAGHLIDVTELFCWRARAALTADTPPSLDRPVPPWRLLDGKGYPEVPAPTIVEGLRVATADALDLIGGIRPEDWGRTGLVRGRATTVLDLGTWQANHNIAHLAQIEALTAN